MTALALLASLLWGGADFVAGTATKRLHPLAVTGAVHAVGFVGLLGWALASGGLADQPGRDRAVGKTLRAVPLHDRAQEEPPLHA